jgi:hypothetical protein
MNKIDFEIREGSNVMNVKQSDVEEALKAIENACLKCKKHCDSCYIAVAARSIAILRKSRDNGLNEKL